MFHENLRVARNHRGLAARAVTTDSETQPTVTPPDGKKDDPKGHQPQKTDTPDEQGPQPVTSVASITPQTTLSIVQTVIPTAPDTVAPKPVVTPSSAPAPAPAPPVRPSSITTSILPVTTTSSVATSSISSSKSVSTIPSKAITVEKASFTSHAAISAKPSASSAPVASGAVSGGAVAGGVIGGLAGLALLIAFVILIVRHYRKKSLDDLVFNASKFRRSALLLDDPPAKEKMQEQRGPRPPSMIARHVNAPAVPQVSAASPYSEHAIQSTDPYGHYAAAAAQYNLGVYGADGQVTRDPYADVYNVNSASPQHVSHGQPAFGAAPMQFQFPQRPYHQQQGYQNSLILGAQASAATVNAPLPNPISNAPSASSALVAARTAAQAQTPSSDSAHTQSRDTSSKPEVLHRRPSAQSTACPPAYADDPKYANIQRDVKVAPGTLAAVNNDDHASLSSASAVSVARQNPSSSAAPVRSNTRRPLSSYTVYDPEDAYGGV